MKVKVFIPIVSSTIFNQVFITKEYDCWKIKAEENHLNIYAKVPDNHPHELLACFNWSQIIGYEVVKFDFQKPDYKHLLSNLLSVIHRDVGSPIETDTQ